MTRLRNTDGAHLIDGARRIRRTDGARRISRTDGTCSTDSTDGTDGTDGIRVTRRPVDGIDSSQGIVN